MDLSEIMVKSVIVIDAEEPVRNAVELMNKYEIGCLVVMENGEPIGIVTERDILKRMIPVYPNAARKKSGK